MIFRLIATAALVAFAILTKGSPLSITLYICAYLVIGFVAATSRFADFRNVGHIREKNWL